MAITTKRVYLNASKIGAALIPDGHTAETSPATIGTVNISTVKEFPIDASDVVNATKATAFDTLIKTELVSAIDAHIAAVGGLNMDITNTVQYNAEVIRIALGSLADDIYLPDANKSIVVTVRLNVAVS